MSSIVEFRIRSPDMFLAPTLAEDFDVTLEVLAEIGTDPSRPYLFVRATGEDVDAFETAVADDPTVAAIECYERFDGGALYRMQVSEATAVVGYQTWVEGGLRLVKARWCDGWWHTRMRCPDREVLGAIADWCDRHEVTFELKGIYENRTPEADEPRLTPEQLQVLTTAYELGYFEIPRGASMAEVAEALDISNQAVSERLRRGYRRLVEDHVV